MPVCVENDTLMLMQRCHEEGNVQLSQNCVIEAEGYQREAIRLACSYSDTASIIARKTCAMARHGLAEALIAQGEIEEAEACVLEALAEEERQHSLLGQSICWATLGNICLQQNRQDSAEMCFSRSRVFSDSLNSHLSISLAASRHSYRSLRDTHRMALWFMVGTFLLLFIAIIVLLILMRRNRPTSPAIAPTTDNATSPTADNRDADFMEHLDSYIMSNIRNGNITAEMICREMGMSATPLRIKLKSLTGLSLGNYILEIRMTYARHLVEDTKMPLAEVALECGFSSFSYFSQSFKKYFGDSPSQMRK